MVFSFFKRSALPKQRVSLSETYSTNLPGLNEASAFISKKDYDPNKVIHDHDKFTADVDTKLDRLSRSDTQFSFAVWVKLRGSSTPWFLQLKKVDGQKVKNPDKLIHELIAKFEQQGEYSLQTYIAQALRSCIVHGAVYGEVVLDGLNFKKIAWVAPAHIKYKEDKAGEHKPWQVLTETEGFSQGIFDDILGVQRSRFVGNADPAKKMVSLDVPTFFRSLVDPHLTNPYHIQPGLPVLSCVYDRREFMQDLFRVVKRMGWPRIAVKALSESIAKSLPESIRRGSPKEQLAYVRALTEDMAKTIQNLAPGDIIHHSDNFAIGTLESNGQGPNTLNPKPLLDTLDQELAQAAKTYASVLGSGGDPDQLQVYIESMSLKGYQEAVAAFFSKVFNLLLRLDGKNILCEFKFADFEMRPMSELESSRMLRYKTDLECVMLGTMTPDEFSQRNTGSPLPGKSVLSKLFNNLDAFKQYNKISEEDSVEPSDTDSPLSPGKKGAKDGDGRRDPTASTKRGQKPSAKAAGDIKRTRTGETRPPRTK